MAKGKETKHIEHGMSKVKGPGGMPETKELPHPKKNKDMKDHISDHSGGSHCPEDFSSYDGRDDHDEDDD